MKRDPIEGYARFFHDCTMLWKDGNMNPKPRFLCTINAYKNWITQIEILGSIPWFQGETRAVKLTALSDSFHEELLASQEPAYILGGPEHIGMFWKK